MASSLSLHPNLLYFSTFPASLLRLNDWQQCATILATVCRFYPWFARSFISFLHINTPSTIFCFTFLVFHLCYFIIQLVAYFSGHISAWLDFLYHHISSVVLNLKNKERNKERKKNKPIIIFKIYEGWPLMTTDPFTLSVNKELRNITDLYALLRRFNIIYNIVKT